MRKGTVSISFEYNKEHQEFYKKFRDDLKRELSSQQFLHLIGVRLNGVGTPNPLGNVQDVLTPTYRWLHLFRQFRYFTDDESVISDAKRGSFKVRFQLNERALTFNKLKYDLESKGIELYSEEECNKLVQFFNLENNVELLFIMKRPGEIPYSFLENITGYFLPECRESLSVYTKLENNELTIYTLKPLINSENLREIVKNLLELNNLTPIKVSY